MTKGYYRVGGLVGSVESNVIIKNCYATGAVSGSSYIGGLIGLNNSYFVSNCYAAGIVTGSNFSSTGGFAGNSNPAVSNCFWDKESSLRLYGVGANNFSGIIGKTTAEMKSIATFVNAGWNIADMNGSDLSEWLMIADGQDYPKLQVLYWQDRFAANPPFLGSGTEVDPYQINSPEDFAALGNHPAAWDKYILLMADVDLTGYSVMPIGNPFYKFAGNFNGQGYTISNATMNFPEKNYVGLFGRVSAGGVISDLGIEDVNIAGKKFVGGLAGFNSAGSITNCDITGVVKPNSSSFAGGLVGFSTRTEISD
jgi:hypothetical protein